MNVIVKQIELIKRIDQLIQMQATGSSVDLANRLKISKAQLYRIVEIMRQLGAPVVYDITLKSFIYEESVDFKFGFYNKEFNLNSDTLFI